MGLTTKPIHIDYQCLSIFGLTDRELRRMLYDCGVRIWPCLDDRGRTLFEYVELKQLVRGAFKHTRWRKQMIPFFRVNATCHLDVDPMEVLAKINSYWIAEVLTDTAKRKKRNLKEPTGWKAFDD